jgi:hypothetical protein
VIDHEWAATTRAGPGNAFDDLGTDDGVQILSPSEAETWLVNNSIWRASVSQRLAASVPDAYNPATTRTIFPVLGFRKREISARLTSGQPTKAVRCKDVVLPLRAGRPALGELLDRVTTENLPAKVILGPKVGKEVR